jgi:hypothetical protein
MLTRYPGVLLSDELGYRALKCYVFKFIKGNVTRIPRFDIKQNKMTEKKYYFFKTLRPLFGEYHSEKNLTTIESLRSEYFFPTQKKLFFMPQYWQEKEKTKATSYVFYCLGREIKEYLDSMTADDVQNITIFDNKFTWAIDLFEGLATSYTSKLDVMIYIKKPSNHQL